MGDHSSRRRIAPPPQATNPGDGPEPGPAAVLPPLFGLAPGGVCRAGPVAGTAVRSYRTLSTLARPKPRRFAFCGTVPGVAPAGRYPAPSFCGARTFLPRRVAPAAARPSGNASCSRLSPPVRAARAGSRGISPSAIAVESLGTETALEGADAACSVGDVIAEALQREQEAAVGPMRIDQIFASGAAARGRSLASRSQSNSSPGSSLRVGRDVRMADDIAAA